MVNQDLETLNFDDSLAYLDATARNGISIGYRLKIINDLSENNVLTERLNTEVTPDFIDQTFLIIALFTYEQPLTKKQIIAKFRLNRHQIISNHEIEAILQKLIDDGLIKQRHVGKIVYYDLINPDLIKFKYLMKGY